MESADAAAAEIAHLKGRVRKLAEEKAHLQLIISLVERLNPLSGLEGLVRGLLYNIMETVGGTNIKLYYWVESKLHYADFIGEHKKLEAIDDDVVAEVEKHHEFIELPAHTENTLIRGDIVPHGWIWAFPLLVGQELVGVIKLENLHISGAPLRNYLPIFFSHAALILSNEIRAYLRQKIEESLREKTEELDSYFNNALDLFCIADTQGYFLKLNPEWEHALGYGLEELEGHRFLDLVHPDDLQATLDAVSTLSAQQPVFNFVNRYRHKDGSWRWLEWRSRSSGSRIFAAAHDITERKNVESKLLLLNAELERRVQDEVARNREKDLLMIQQSRLAAMGEMVHNIAHQWRQPINALALVLANIKDDYAFKQLTAESLERDVRAGQRLIQNMSTTIDDFRNFFMPNKEKEFFLTDETVDGAIKLVSDSFAAHSITIIHEKDAEPCRVQGYPQEFAQVVLNALSNAKEAIEGKGVTGEIRIKTKRDGNVVVVSILDNGGGIPENILDKVFDPYFTTKESGSGIGLYMSKMIMNNMGGAIAIRNAGEGAEVSISLPVARLA